MYCYKLNKVTTDICLYFTKKCFKIVVKLITSSWLPKYILNKSLQHIQHNIVIIT